MRRLIVLLSLLIRLALVRAAAADEVKIALQPLGKVPADIVEKARVHLEEIYAVHVAVQPATDLPASAFYRPRQRYRADRLLDWLDAKAAPEFAKVIGVTAADISTTKGDVFDWGIFGLGQLGRRSCVISTFRLGRDVPRGKMLIRTQRVAAHEVGHTFGLEHCATPGCMMSDAEGKVSTRWTTKRGSSVSAAARASLQRQALSRRADFGSAFFALLRSHLLLGTPPHVPRHRHRFRRSHRL